MKILELAEKQGKRKNRIFLVVIMLMQSYQRNAEISAGCILQLCKVNTSHNKTLPTQRVPL